VLVELAELLEAGPHGGRLSAAPADLRAAIAVLRDAVALAPHSEHVNELARDLIIDHRPDEAAKLLEPAARSTTRDALLVAAIALGARGSGAALAEADTLASGDARTKLLASAGWSALAAREYDVARALLGQTDALRVGSPTELVKRIVRHDKPFKSRGTVEDALVESVLDSVHPDRPQTAFWDAETAKEARQQSTETFAQIGHMPLSDALIDDLLVSALDPRVEGDANAWRVTLDLGSRHAVEYLAADHGVAKTIGDPKASAGVGRHVLRLLARNDEASAKRLLDWVAADAGGMVRGVWGPNLPTDRAAIQLAGAVLAAPTEPDRVLPILKSCGATTSAGQLVCDTSVLVVLETAKRWPELLEFATEWEARSPHDVAAVVAHAEALRWLGHFDSADKVLDDASARFPDEPLLHLLGAMNAFARRDVSEAMRRGDAVAKSPRVTSAELNSVAWLGLYAASDLAGAAERARSSVRLAPKSAAQLNTLAGLEVELGDLRAGKDDELKAMELAGHERPEDADWYVIGRLYEQAGLREDAIATYKRVKSTTEDPGLPVASMFAARRLTALGVKR